MKLYIFVISIFLNLSNSILTNAQSYTEIEMINSIALGKLVSSSEENFDAKYSYSFGVMWLENYKSKIYFNTGIVLRGQGAKTQLPPIDGTDEYEIIVKSLSLEIPFGFGYYIISKSKLKIGIDIGLKNGFLLNQKSFSKRGRATGSKINFYEKYLTHFNMNLNFRSKLSKSICLSLRPYWSRQLNTNKINFKQINFGLELGLSYKMKKNPTANKVQNVDSRHF